MGGVLPRALQNAISRLFAADDSTRMLEQGSSIERIGALRAGRATVLHWRQGRLTTAEALAQLDALAEGIREQASRERARRAG